MREKNIIVFIKVRPRQSNHYGDSTESITKSKQHRLIKTANHYLKKHRLSHRAICRFNVIGLCPQQLMVWIKNTFQSTSTFD